MMDKGEKGKRRDTAVFCKEIAATVDEQYAIWFIELLSD